MSFQFGICTQTEQAPIALRAGCDFLESAFCLTAAQTEEQFRASLQTVRAVGLPILAMNSMLPGQFVLYGNEEQDQAVCDFVKIGMERAALLGVKTVVFGSGTARRVPENMEHNEAAERLAILLGRFCEIAGSCGVRLAIEPLRAEETNFCHTLPDAYRLLSSISSGTLGINPDIYHMLAAKEDFSALSTYREQIYHLHICSPERTYPLPGNCQNDAIYKDFLRAVIAMGSCCEISIEGITKQLEADAVAAIPHLRALAEEL